MELSLVALAALACPIGMGLMMWFMAKGMRSGGEKDQMEQSSVEDLRAEQQRLAAEVERLEGGERTRGEAAVR